MLPSHWPKWTLFFIAFGLTVAIIIIGLILEPIGLALAPTVTPEEALPTINYAKPLSMECEGCHLDRGALVNSGATAEEIERLLIGAESLQTPHGGLGCITCHGGTGETADKDAAHEGLRTDLAETHPEDCVVCHRSLPAEIPEDHLRTPHGEIVNAVWQGSDCGVTCTECHGAIGHGLDPVTGGSVCPMSVCTDCHGVQNLNTNLARCETCHLGPHTLAADAPLCEDCHLSTETWHETVKLGTTAAAVQPAAAVSHELEMVGKHGELNCFACHRWPEFTGLDAACRNCHARPHEQGNDDCALCHNSEGWQTSIGLVLARAMDSSHPSEGLEACRECHTLEGDHATLADHEDFTEETCQACHAFQFAPGILHPVAGREECLECHGEGGAAQFPYDTHHTFVESQCRTCHAPEDAVAMDVSHTVERRGDCLMCHGPVSIVPFPASHAGRENGVCQLCHLMDGTPTATAHLFPTSHQGAADNCALCHTNLAFDSFQCDTCHSGATIDTIHLDRGIKLEEDCTICHPEGKKPLSSG